MKKPILAFIFLMYVSCLTAQITSTGLPIALTQGTTMSVSAINTSGRLVNNGNIITDGNITAGTYAGNGSINLRGGNQTINLSREATIGTLNVQGGGIKTFPHRLNISSSLVLANGILVCTAGDVRANAGATVSGGSNSSYINGRLVQVGQSNMVFPIGKGNRYMPVTLIFNQAQQATLALEFIEDDPQGIAGNGVLRVSNTGYWQLTTLAGTFNGAELSLPMRNETIAPSLQEIVVVGASPTSNIYRSYGRKFTTGSLQTGTIVSASSVPSGKFTLGLFFDEQLRVADSLALINFYSDTDGQLWRNRQGWRTALLDNWHGITMKDKRVSAIRLPDNNLKGSITSASITPLVKLEALDVSKNALTSIPSFNAMNNLTSINVSDNRLGFASLEEQTKLGNMTYIPQAIVLNDTSQVVEIGQISRLIRQIPGRNNAYTWRKDGSAISGGTRGELFVQNAKATDEGKYHAVITNSAVPGLTLTTNSIQLFVSSLQRDIQALLELYATAGGSNWKDPSGAPIRGWNANTNISEWSFVGLTSTGLRVNSVNLANVGLRGPVPDAISAMSFVNTFDFANNDVTRIPVLKNIPSLKKLDVSNNRLQYGSIQRNLGISDFKFAPQKPLAETIEVKVPQGTLYVLEIPVDGVGLTYQWTYKGNPLAGATTSRLEIPAVEYENMGEYRMIVKDKLVIERDPNFDITTGALRLLATASISGTVVNIDNAPVTDGTIILWAIRPPGLPYDSIGRFPMTGNTFTINDVVLDDYIAMAVTDLQTYLPTYHTSAVTWSIADRIRLRRTTTGVNFRTINVPSPLLPGPDNDNEVNGVIELDTDNFPPGTFDNAGGRMMARRRVADVGVAFNRQRAVNRDENEVFELVAYTRSDENGFFKSVNLPAGNYRIVMEFPGIPMDPKSYVEFFLGEDETLDDKVLNLFAEIKPAGITVEKFSETGVRRNYFRGLNIFPNPADTYVNIAYERLNSDGIVLQLIDLSGAVKLQHVVPKGHNQQLQLDVSHIQPGIYVLTFMDERRGIRHVVSSKVLISR